MKKTFIFLSLILLNIVCYGQRDSISIYHKINHIEASNASLKRDVVLLKKDNSVLENRIGNLSNKVSKDSTDLKETTLFLQDTINHKTSAVQVILKKEIQSKSGKISLFVVFFLLLAVAGLVYFLLRNKIKGSESAIESIGKTQKFLQEESIKLDNKLLEIREAQLNVNSASNLNQDLSSKPDHSLALKVADEIIRIETNLSRMDPTIRGYKQLSKSVERIKENFMAQGYEIVEMLGKPYQEGIKGTVNFVTDNTLKDGERIITGIIKPQVNFKNTMIQAGQITVSQK